MSDWNATWELLRSNLWTLPPCPEHPNHPHVRTLSQGVINDIINVTEHEIIVHSHRSENEDQIPAAHFKAWWNHLSTGKPATTDTSDPNCPEPYRSSVTAAIFVQALPGKIEQIDQRTIVWSP